MPTTFGIALQRGLLHEEFDGDADVSFRALQESSDPAVLQSHYTHTQPNSLRHGGNYPAIYAQASGARTRVVGLSFQRASQAILALPETGLRGVKDLKGRRLGVPRRPHEPVDHAYLSALRTYETALRSEGLSLADVQIVEHLITSAYIHDRPKQKTHFGAPEPEQNRKDRPRLEPHAVPAGARRGGPRFAVGGANATLFENPGRAAAGVRPGDAARQRNRANNNSPLVFAVKEGPAANAALTSCCVCSSACCRPRGWRASSRKTRAARLRWNWPRRRPRCQLAPTRNSSPTWSWTSPPSRWRR